MLILILVLLLLFGGGLGYRQWGAGTYGNGGYGIIGIIVLVLLLVWLFGGGLHGF
jgi:hypothetical protein